MQAHSSHAKYQNRSLSTTHLYCRSQCALVNTGEANIASISPCLPSLQAEEGEDEEERGQERDDDERSSTGKDRHHHGCITLESWIRKSKGERKKDGYPCQLKLCPGRSCFLPGVILGGCSSKKQTNTWTSFMKYILTTDDDAKDGQRDHEASAPDADGGVDGGLVAEVVLGQ